MTQPQLYKALATGAENVTVWAQLIDKINVFPVADGDTGRNLVISLAPLRKEHADPHVFCQNLLLSARGNAGNIAVSFLEKLVCMTSLQDWTTAVKLGRDAAYRAVVDPQPGTMLSFFDQLVEICGVLPSHPDPTWTISLLQSLEHTVAKTIDKHPILKRANVVDAGALGIYIFFDGFFSYLANTKKYFSPISASFKDYLNISADFRRDKAEGFCIDAVLTCDTEYQSNFNNVGKSTVVMKSGPFIKVHTHVNDLQKAKHELTANYSIVAWADDNIATQTTMLSGPSSTANIHVMTDAAGSFTRDDAAGYGVSLLDSYITMGDTNLPESCCSPSDLYKLMKSGIPCSTSQASLSEKKLRYASVLDLHQTVLYICVGSTYTGNCETALHWKQEYDTDNRFNIIDSGTASGRLAVAVHVTARCARSAGDIDKVELCAKSTLSIAKEYIFIDDLKYLAAGGRLSNIGAFFSNMLRLKPVISPLKDGAQKVAMLRNRLDQERFALSRLEKEFEFKDHGLILLQYTDNQSLVEDIAAKIENHFQKIELLVRPLSLTTGVHTGPGTWAVAFVSLL